MMQYSCHRHRPGLQRAARIILRVTFGNRRFTFKKTPCYEKHPCVDFYLHGLFCVSAQDTTAQLLAKEKEMFSAVCNGDKPAAEKLFASDYITIDADGKLQSREETMAGFGKFKGSTFALSGQTVRLYGHTAVITGRAVFHVKSILAADVYYTEIWTDRGNGWEFSGWQGTMTGLPSWYPVIGTAILLLLLFVIARWIRKRKAKKKRG